MVTSGTIHWVLQCLNIPIHIRDICVFLAPIFSGMTALATYFLTKELWNSGAGLFAACFIAIGGLFISHQVFIVKPLNRLHCFFLTVCCLFSCFIAKGGIIKSTVQKFIFEIAGNQGMDCIFFLTVCRFISSAWLY